MMVTALSTQHKELTFDGLTCTKKKKERKKERKKNRNFWNVSAAADLFLVFHQLLCHENITLLLNRDYLKNLSLIHHQTIHYYRYQMPK